MVFSELSQGSLEYNTTGSAEMRDSISICTNFIVNYCSWDGPPWSTGKSGVQISVVAEREAYGDQAAAASN